MQRQNALNFNPIDNSRTYTQAIHHNFRAVAGGGSNPLYGTRDCPICYEQFDQSGNNLAESKPCGHTSCEECLATHFRTTSINFSCPCCRVQITEIITISEDSTSRNEIPQIFVDRVLPDSLHQQTIFRSPVRARYANYDHNYGNPDILYLSIPVIEIEQPVRITAQDNLVTLRKEIREAVPFLGKNTGIIFMSHMDNSINPEDVANNTNSNNDLFIIADISGSMYARMHCLKEGIIKTINTLKPSQRISIIVFNDQAYHLFPMQQITTSNKHEIIEKINSLSSSGGTNFNPVFSLLERALGDAIRTGIGRKIVTLFFSDGDHTDQLDYEMIDRIYATNPALNMYTASIGEGVNASHSLEPILRERPYELSRYIHIPDTDGFENVLASIIGENSDSYATNIRITFINAKPLSGQIIDDYSLVVSNLNTNSEIVIPYELLNDNDVDITYTFQKHNGVVVSGSFSEDTTNILPNTLTIFFPRKKMVAAEIIKITSNDRLSNQTKYNALTALKDSITEEMLNEFYNEFITEITRIMNSYIYEDNSSQNISTETQVNLVRSHTTPMARSMTRAVSSGMRSQTQAAVAVEETMDV
jgi:hypothetical protein